MISRKPTIITNHARFVWIELIFAVKNTHEWNKILSPYNITVTGPPTRYTRNVNCQPPFFLTSNKIVISFGGVSITVLQFNQLGNLFIIQDENWRHEASKTSSLHHVKWYYTWCYILKWSGMLNHKIVEPCNCHQSSLYSFYFASSLNNTRARVKLVLLQKMELAKYILIWKSALPFRKLFTIHNFRVQSPFLE